MPYVSRRIFSKRLFDTTVLGRCAFSLEMNVQQNPDNPYMKKVNELFTVNLQKRWSVRLTSVLPSFIGIFIFQAIIKMNGLFRIWNKRFSFFQFKELPYLWLLSRIGEHALSARNDTKQSQRTDLLSIMLRAASDENIIVS